MSDSPFDPYRAEWVLMTGLGEGPHMLDSNMMVVIHANDDEVAYVVHSDPTKLAVDDWDEFRAYLTRVVTYATVGAVPPQGMISVTKTTPQRLAQIIATATEEQLK